MGGDQKSNLWKVGGFFCCALPLPAPAPFKRAWEKLAIYLAEKRCSCAKNDRCRNKKGQLPGLEDLILPGSQGANINGTALRHLRAGQGLPVPLLAESCGCHPLSDAGMEVVSLSISLPACFFCSASAVSYFFALLAPVKISHGVLPTLRSLLGAIALTFSLHHLSLYLPFCCLSLFSCPPPSLSLTFLLSGYTIFFLMIFCPLLTLCLFQARCSAGIQLGLMQFESHRG